MKQWTSLSTVLVSASTDTPSVLAWIQGWIWPHHSKQCKPQVGTAWPRNEVQCPVSSVVHFSPSSTYHTHKHTHGSASSPPSTFFSSTCVLMWGWELLHEATPTKGHMRRWHSGETGEERKALVLYKVYNRLRSRVYIPPESQTTSVLASTVMWI